MEFASEEKLRREIRELSQMIAASNGGVCSTNQVYSYTRAVNNFNTRQHPSTFRQPYRAPTNRNLKQRYRYPNPFDQFSTDGYIKKVFPESGETRLSVGVATRDASYLSPYRLKNNTNDDCISTNLSKMPLTSSQISVNAESRTTVVEKMENKPVSIHINPSYLTQSSSGDSSRSLSLSQCGVRPHINPAHSSFQLLAANNGSNSHQLSRSISVPAPSTSAESHVYNHEPGYSNNNAILSTNQCDNVSKSQEAKALTQVTNTNTRCIPSLKTKYKLDRREERSPVRKARKVKIIAAYKLLTTPKTKLFKRYSMRTVSAAKYSVSSWKPQRFGRFKTATEQHLTRKLSRRYNNIPASVSLRSAVVVKKGNKSVVHIDGSKFITKNGGKTLKRMNSKMNVVSINGNRFVRKNGGKSLKRLSESGGKCSKPVLSILSQQQQTPGVRLANRAVQRSKYTLSQRIWKKKRLCVFYNRFGECKRKDAGSCPYIHDRKQLMICPKFIVKTCSNKDCKLSHDLTVGRMPPCQFFNKSKCSRENCPYPHVKSSPFNKKTTETVKCSKGQVNRNGTGDIAKLSTPRKRKLSLRKESSKFSVESAESKKNKTKRTDPKSRYYEQSPDSQPTVSIIPRRLPHHSNQQSKSDDEKKAVFLVPKTVPSTSSTGVEVDLGEISNNVIDCADNRRMRLMSRISRLHARTKKKESTAPQFLPFN